MINADFNFYNRYSVAFCLAKQLDLPFQQVRDQLLGAIANGIESVPFNHNVRSSLISTGIYILYSSGKV